MLKKLFPYLVVFIGLWYLPEIYTFVRNIAASVYNEASTRTEYRVEMKVVKPIPYLPEKFSVLLPGTKDLWIEFAGLENSTVIGLPTDDTGIVVWETLPKGVYSVRVGKKPTIPDREIADAQANGYSILDANDLIKTNLEEILVTKDSNFVAIMREIH